jgi:hypothetical protein
MKYSIDPPKDMISGMPTESHLEIFKHEGNLQFVLDAESLATYYSDYCCYGERGWLSSLHVTLSPRA